MKTGRISFLFILFINLFLQTLTFAQSKIPSLVCKIQCLDHAELKQSKSFIVDTPAGKSFTNFCGYSKFYFSTETPQLVFGNETSKTLSSYRFYFQTDKPYSGLQKGSKVVSANDQSVQINKIDQKVEVRCTKAPSSAVYSEEIFKRKEIDCAHCGQSSETTSQVITDLASSSAAITDQIKPPSPALSAFQNSKKIKSFASKIRVKILKGAACDAANKNYVAFRNILASGYKKGLYQEFNPTVLSASNKIYTHCFSVLLSDGSTTNYDDVTFSEGKIIYQAHGIKYSTDHWIDTGTKSLQKYSQNKNSGVWTLEGRSERAVRGNGKGSPLGFCNVTYYQIAPDIVISDMTDDTNAPSFDIILLR